jgi:phosphate transport system permease protein
MQRHARQVLDRSFTAVGGISILLLAGVLFVLLWPIVSRGMGAFVFRGTVEHREVMLEEFDHGDRAAVQAESAKVAQARQKVYDMIAAFERELADMSFLERRKYRSPLEELKDGLRQLLGPFPEESTADLPLPRMRFGETRWDRVEVAFEQVMFVEQYVEAGEGEMLQRTLVPRVKEFEGTSLAALFPYMDKHLEDMLQPRWTFYWRFLTDVSSDAHFFGGIWAELLGTVYLTIGAVLFAIPMGVISAIYLVEYADPESRIVGMIRTCISTLAGVPSIVFGLFGLAFFVIALPSWLPDWVPLADTRNTLAGSLTLAILILPLVIRSSEEAIRAVPFTYKEASLSLGAGKWRTITTVILPAALPGIITGIVISMGRAAGETAPIIFTAAVTVGAPLAIWETLDQPTPALPWNVYNLCTEHAKVDQIRHVQYGMVFTLVALVLGLNGLAIYLRARISRKLRG